MTRGSGRAWLAATLGLLACHQGRPATEGQSERSHGRAAAAPLLRASRVRPLVMRLASTDADTARAARAELRSWKGPKAPSPAGAIELLRASANVFPTETPGRERIGTEIIGVLAETPRPEYGPVVEEVFPRLSASAREAALALLQGIDDPAAAESLLRLLHAHVADLSVMFSMARLRAHPHHADIFFPRLLDLAQHDALADEVYMTALEFCEKHLLSEETLRGRAAPLRAAYRTQRDWLLPRQQGRVGWMWADDYQRHRETASLLLDLAQCQPIDDVEPDLTAALAYRDPRLAYFAIKSLMARDRSPPAAAVAAVAASAEMRNHLYERLNARALTDLIPARFRTQAALAESNMVEWLVYPTELGQVPDQIELKKVVSIDTESADGVLDYYLFRFKTAPPHWAAKQGWLAGVAGPFLRKEAPTTEAQGDTFSKLERWDARKPEQHVGDARVLLDEWRRRRAKEAQSDDG